MTDNLDDHELEEPPEFDYSAHTMICSAQAGALLLEVYEIDTGYHWELVDQYGRTHDRAGADTVEEALSAGADAAGETLLIDDGLEDEEAYEGGNRPWE